jgi:hypothetical protein
MKKLALLLLITLLAIPALAQAGHVNGYYRSNGTYVEPYERSDPNGTVQDNYSYIGNTNPYTGAVGTNRYEHDVTSPYYEGPDSQGNSGHSGYDSNPYGQ